MLAWLQELFAEFGNWLLSVLPHSPIADFIDSLSGLPYLNYLNWFMPVRSILRIYVAYLSAIALFYVYSIIARWVKLIGD